MLGLRRFFFSQVGLRCLLASLMLAINIPVYADMLGYVDAKGRFHAVSEPGQSYADLRALNPVEADAISFKKRVFFEVSPKFKTIKHHVKEAAIQHNVDYALLQAVMVTESGLNASVVSPKGAVGLMQLMPATAKRYGVHADAEISIEKRLTDPKVNIQAGARYLRYLMDLFPGKLELSVAAYNAGEGAVRRAGHQIPEYKETQNYVRQVLKLYHQLKVPTDMYIYEEFFVIDLPPKASKNTPEK